MSPTKKKVLLVITKSNWGEKWAGTHFARLIADAGEFSSQQSNEWTAAVSRRQPPHTVSNINYGT